MHARHAVRVHCIAHYKTKGYTFVHHVVRALLIADRDRAREQMPIKNLLEIVATLQHFRLLLTADGQRGKQMPVQPPKYEKVETKKLYKKHKSRIHGPWGGPKGTPGVAKSPQERPANARREPNRTREGSKGNPEGSKRDPHGAKCEGRGRQKTASGTKDIPKRQKRKNPKVTSMKIEK